MILIVTSHIHVISCAVVLPFFVKTHMYNKTCFHFQHIHIHDNNSINGNNIGDDGAKCLSEGLKYCPQLRTLK